MMKLGSRCINRSSRAVCLGAVAGSAVCLGCLLNARGQAMPNTLLVDYVSPSLLSPSLAPHPMMPTNTTLAAEPKAWEPGDLIKPTGTTAVDRWTVFESEYGIQEASSSPIGRMFQVAKYGLDRMTFTAQETAQKLEFTYDLGEAPPNEPGSRIPTPQYSLPMFGRFGQAQIKSAVTIHDPQTGEAFIGLKLVIPFGQGG
jgi:hypothetical protein